MMSTRMPDRCISERCFDDKAAARAAVWQSMMDHKVARFPFPIKGRIPNFAGADAAAAHLLSHPAFASVRCVKVNPDSPQRYVRKGLLERGIAVVTPTPRLRGGFYLLDPERIPAENHWDAASMKMGGRFGEPLALDRLPHVDLVVMGCTPRGCIRTNARTQGAARARAAPTLLSLLHQTDDSQTGALAADAMTKAAAAGIITSAMRLHQLKVEFDAEQDRLLMRVSTASSEEALLWLTRRCVLRLWELLMGFVQSKPEIVARAADPVTRRTLMEFEHEKALTGATFNKAYEELARVHPLGDAPLLVSRLQRRPTEDGRMVLGLLPAEGQGIFLTLDNTLLHGLMKLLERAVEKAEWGFSLNLPAAPADSQPGSQTLN